MNKIKKGFIGLLIFALAITSLPGLEAKAQSASQSEAVDRTGNAVIVNDPELCRQVVTIDNAEGINYAEGSERLGDSKYNITKYVAGYNWDKYGSKYYYNKLTKDEKKFWDDLDKACKDLMFSNINIKTWGGEFVSYKTVKNKLKSTDTFKVWYMFILSNPQYYFLANSCGAWDKECYIFIYDKFAKASDRKTANDKLKRSLDAMLDEIVDTSVEGVNRVITADLLIDEVVEYDYDYESRGTINWCQSVYSAAVEHLTVCTGYAKLNTMIGNALGYEVVPIVSDTHAWNATKVGKKWYLTDLTWADGTYTLDTTIMLTAKDNITIDDEHHRAISCIKKYIPSCKNNYEHKSRFVAVSASQKIKKGKMIFDVNSDSGPEVYYTLDGSIPTEDSIKYEKPINISGLEPGTIVTALTFFPEDGIDAASRVRKYRIISRPVIDSLYSKANGINIKWSMKTTTQNCTIYRKTEAEEYTELVRIPCNKQTSFSYVDSSAKANTVYTYMIVADDNAGNFSQESHEESACLLKTTISSLKKKSTSSFKLTWKKNSKASGYQIEYSTSSKFKTSKFAKVKKTTSKTITGLSKKKTYYVRIRPFFKLEDGTVVYGAWTSKKKVKLK